MNWSYLPNLITLLRIVILFPLSLFLLNENYEMALLLFVIAGFSDAADGFLAKKFSWVSRFGAILDPLADKALLIVTMAILSYNGHLAWLLFIVAGFRDIYIVIGAYYYHYKFGPYQMQPSYLSKFNTFTQLLLVTYLLVSLGYYPLPNNYLTWLIGLTYITIISSGIHYTWVWGKKLNQQFEMLKQQTLKQQNLHDN